MLIQRHKYPGSSIQVRNLHGATVPVSDIIKKDSSLLVCFWSQNNPESINELNAINDQLESWKQSLKFRLIAVCVDEGKLVGRVRSTAVGNGWRFDVVTEIDGDFRKALNANNLPMALLVQNGKILYQQSGYEPGSEIYLQQKMNKLFVNQ